MGMKSSLPERSQSLKRHKTVCIPGTTLESPEIGSECSTLASSPGALNDPYVDEIDVAFLIGRRIELLTSSDRASDSNDEFVFPHDDDHEVITYESFAEQIVTRFVVGEIRTHEAALSSRGRLNERSGVYDEYRALFSYGEQPNKSLTLTRTRGRYDLDVRGGVDGSIRRRRRVDGRERAFSLCYLHFFGSKIDPGRVSARESLRDLRRNRNGSTRTSRSFTLSSFTLEFARFARRTRIRSRLVVSARFFCGARITDSKTYFVKREFVH